LNSGLSLLLVQSSVSQPLLALGVLENLSLAVGDNLSDWLGVALSLNSVWLSNDGLVNLLVKIFTGLKLGGGEALVPLGEEDLVLGWVFLLDLVHVGSNVSTEDSILVDLSVVRGLGLLGISGLSSLVGNDLDLRFGVTWESLNGMRNVKTSIASTLECSEDSGTSGGSLDTNIKESLEWSLLTFALNEEHFTVNLIGWLVVLIKSDLLEESSGNQKTGAVMSGVVGKTSSKTVSFELGGIS